MKFFDINNPERRNPFTVPEGYFDNLTARIMEQIPNKETATTPTAELRPKHSHRWMKWAIAAAACVALVVVIKIAPQYLLPNLTPQATAIVTDDELTVDEQYEQDVLEYAMIDNSDIYSYLAEGL